MARIVHKAMLGRNHAWSRKQTDVMLSDRRIICVDGGRRFGKSRVGAGKFVARMSARIQNRIEAVRDGIAPPWPGIGMKASKAKHLHPDIECWVVTPRERHLRQCRNYILEYFQGSFRSIMHPELGFIDGGKQVWLLVGGVSARILFAVGSSATSMVSGAIDVIWVDEAGLMENIVIEALRPALWERMADEIYTGTPSLGTEHYFTQLIMSGLDPNDEMYDEHETIPNEDVFSVVGSSFEAFLPEVRQRAKEDESRFGKAWADQWLRGDWRLPSLFVYDMYEKEIHVAKYDYLERKIQGFEKTLPPPSLVVGCIDWAYSATNPGAAVVFHVWFRNPIDPDDRVRPLVVAVEDRQVAMEYTRDGWYAVFRELYEKYGVKIWYADPSRDEMIQQAKRRGGKIGRVVPAHKGDKQGRITLVKSLLHHDRKNQIEPAFYINSDSCTHLPRQFSSYRRALNAKGEVMDRTIDYDDHCLDCVAFLVGKIMSSGYSIPRVG